MPKPVYRKLALSAIARPRVNVSEHLTGTEKPLPDSAGVWLYTLTNTKLIVKERAGVLFFPAGEYAEQATPVADLIEQRKNALLSRFMFIKLETVIEL